MDVFCVHLVQSRRGIGDVGGQTRMAAATAMPRRCRGCEGDDDTGAAEGARDVVVVIGGRSEEREAAGAADVVAGRRRSWRGVVVVVGEVERARGVLGIRRTAGQ